MQQEQEKMSNGTDFSYEIEQLYIDGFSPSRIANILECPVGKVIDWLEEHNLLQYNNTKGAVVAA